MKTILTTKPTLWICAALMLAPLSSSKAIDLLSLGTDGFTIQGFDGSYTQNDTTLGFTTVGLGTTVFGEVVGSPLNWSSVPAFGILMTVSSGFEPLLFRLTLYDSSYIGGATGFADYEGSTAALTVGVEGTVALTLTSGAVNTSSLVGLGVTWDTPGAANSSMAAVTAVPEPSTYALLALAGAAVLGVRRFRRRRA
jgi:hypothetical protein